MLKIAIDFDGTIVEHEYPDVGTPIPMALDYMHEFEKLGASLILWTMRDGKELDDAVEYCNYNGIFFKGVNAGIGDRSWTTSPKAHANIYIDDAAFGCPLNFSKVAHGKRPYVDWSIVGPEVVKRLTR